MRNRFRRPAELSAPLALALAVGGCGGDELPAQPGGGGAGGIAGTGGEGGTAGSSVSSSASAGPVGPTSAGAGGGSLPERFTVSGVVTDGNAPVAGAIVLQGGGDERVETGADGTFSVELTTSIPGVPTLVAAKTGYRSAGIEIDALPDEPLELRLSFVTPADNEAYVFGEPGVGDPEIDTSTAQCGHCHTTFVREFRASAHAKATRDPFVQDLYAGTARALSTAEACAAAGGTMKTGLDPGKKGSAVPKCYVGSGVLPDLNAGCGGKKACDDPFLEPSARPVAFGGCADCHAAGLEGKAGGRNLHEAFGTAFESGNHCDVCHKAADVDLGKPPGTAGALVLRRPVDKEGGKPGGKPIPVMFGPYPDVPNPFMGGSYQPRFSSGDFCGACHEQRQPALVPGSKLDPGKWPDGLPTHSTHGEWKASPWAEAGVTCQYCHMPPTETLASTVDVTDAENASTTFGFLRPPDKIRQHVFLGPLSGKPRLLDGSVSLDLVLEASSGQVRATAYAENQLAGHAIPTGEPMRALLLVLGAEACGERLAPAGGMTVPDLGGALASATLGSVPGAPSLAGATLSWPGAAERAEPGMVVRFVRGSGAFDDYDGVGRFAQSFGLPPEERGLEVVEPVAERVVVAVSGSELTLDAPAPGAKPGDRLYLGEPLASPGEPVAEGDASRALAGAPGYAFARVVVAADGRRNVPHYLGVDLASDNRLLPGAPATTTHAFSAPEGCGSAKVTATLLYRPLPHDLARERGWDARDHVVARTSQTIALP